ncbi:hypothetical protein M6D93_12545 [Jatrophihabitans telluris]|uniref:Glycosyltransferase RgtA/B/C/D-like domain-containing protein n=1 Tax=Jatrophihabitans telluris TaxID=2038343 RepID=A0ABY4QVG6_9ACTN|nr:hypothetical protein [Jatrophihabitans telluris]UQX87127.1 hypothetical protein M6D93_12545 [Jatrophihabitans telluris]
MAAILGAQAGWLFVLFDRGWYLQSEISNLADARNASLDWHYLSESLGGHLSPVIRLEYWLLAHLAPLNYSLTIVLRVLGCVAATYLLYRLLVALVGPCWLVTAVTLVYAVSPLTVPGASWLTSAVDLVPSHVLLLLSLLAFLRFLDSGGLRAAAVSGIWLSLAIFTGSGTLAELVVYPVLAFGFLYRGNLRERWGQAVGQRYGWLVLLSPLVCFATLFLSKRSDYATGAHPLSLSDGLLLVRNEWLKAVGPILVGGPWSWFAQPNIFVGYAAPPPTVIIAGQVAFVVLLVLGFTVTRWASVVAWSMPVCTAVGSVLIVGIGRYGVYGQLIPLTLRYSYPVAIPLALAVVLSLRPVNRSGDAAATPRDEELRPARLGENRPLLAVVCVLLVLSSALSAWRFSDDFARNPTRAYVANLTSALGHPGGHVALYDSMLPTQIVSGVEPHHHVSDLLDLAGLRASFDDSSTVPLMVAGDGHLVPVTFVDAAVGVGGTSPKCGFYLSGAGRWQIPLTPAVPRAEWFLQLSLYQANPSTIDVQIVDDHRNEVAPIGGSRLTITATLAQVNRRLPLSAPTSVIITSEDRHASICLAGVAIGAPFPKAG